MQPVVGSSCHASDSLPNNGDVARGIGNDAVRHRTYKPAYETILLKPTTPWFVGVAPKTMRASVAMLTTRPRTIATPRLKLGTTLELRARPVADCIHRGIGDATRCDYGGK